jgi:hypothetical protein
MDYSIASTEKKVRPTEFKLKLGYTCIRRRRRGAYRVIDRDGYALSNLLRLRRGESRGDGLGSGVSRIDRYILSLLTCGVLLFLGPAKIAAQSEKTAPQPKPSVLIASLPLEGSPDEGVRKVLASAMRFQLEQLGTQTLLFSTTDEEALVRDLLGEEEPEAQLLATTLIEFISGLNHDFLALAGYIKEQEQIQVSFYIADLGRGEILASASRRVPIDFSLDEAMIRTLREMLPQAEGRIEEVARRKTAEAAAQQQEVGEALAEQETEPTPLPQESPVVEVEKKERFRPFEFSIGFAPFIPVGVANEVFSLSYAPFVYGNYRIPLSAGVLGIGLYTGLNVFDSEEAGVASYFHYVIPVGVDARFTALEIARIGLFVRARLGVAINVSDFSSLPQIAEEGLSRVLAHGSGGVGAVLAISQSVGIAIDFLYETFVYFYEEDSGGGIKTDWIMGFVPSIYLYTRF